jgi:hypothetical protein
VAGENLRLRSGQAPALQQIPTSRKERETWGTRLHACSGFVFQGEQVIFPADIPTVASEVSVFADYTAVTAAHLLWRV